jgi:cephalosporin-C deacetylase-like acetyl esterase
MNDDYTEFQYYPSPEEVDAWIQSIWQISESVGYQTEQLPVNCFPHNLGINHAKGSQYIKFIPEGRHVFYAYWQPTWSTPAPLLVHIPGYGAEMSAHPELVAQGYNILHISPLGYGTPHGPDQNKMREGIWPVLPDTITSDAEKGYKLWLLDCILAIKWAVQRSEVIRDRVSFFGTSQGGGGALLLGSMFRDKGIRCVAADVPFMTNFPMANGRGAYGMTKNALSKLDSMDAGWRALGFIDTLSHARRLTIPVLLTAGGQDLACPAETIESLFFRLPRTKSYTYLADSEHRYTHEFLSLAMGWFRLYA